MQESIPLTQINKKPECNESDLTFDDYQRGDLITYEEKMRRCNLIEFEGLSREEMLQYINDPFWIKVRRQVAFISVSLYLGLICLTVAVIINSPKIIRDPKLQWWQKEPIYHIEVKSFYDTDMDGYGDIIGLIQAIDYPQQLGFGVIKLGSSIFRSESHQSAFGVINFTAIDEIVGTMDVFDQLIEKAHKKSLRIVLDFPLFATSREISWFKASSYSDHRNHLKYQNSYLLANSTNHIEVSEIFNYLKKKNKWKSEPFDQWASLLTPHQIMLNLNNEQIVNEISKVIRFWLMDKNVDGFNFYMHYKTNDVFMKHIMEFLVKLRRLFDDVSARTMIERLFMITIIGDNPEPLDLFYTFNNRLVAHMVVPDIHRVIKKKLPPGRECVDNIRRWVVLAQTNNYWIGWQLGNPYTTRIGSFRNINLMFPFNLLLTGTPVFMYGDEIPLKSIPNRADLQLPGPTWIYSSISPLQWGKSSRAQFTKGNTTWLPIAYDYVKSNIDRQTASGVRDSNIVQIKRILSMRMSFPSLLFGRIFSIEYQSNVYYWGIEHMGRPGFIVIVNQGKSDAHIAMQIKDVPPTLNVRYSTAKAFLVNSTVGIHNVLIPKFSIILLEWPARV